MQPPPLEEQIAAVMAWWSDAGVDTGFADDATDWLAKPEADEPERVESKKTATDAAAAREEIPRKVDLMGKDAPADLAAFREFWLADPRLALAGSAPRLSPRGDAGAKLMVLVVAPEKEDEGRLLSGPQGGLLTKILAAMGLEESEVYFASVVPQPLPLADGQELANAGFGELLAHHVALVRPDRIVAFGANILPLIGHDAAQASESVQEISHENGSTPLLVVEGLDSLAGMPRLKARFWRRWLAWTLN